MSIYAIRGHKTPAFYWVVVVTVNGGENEICKKHVREFKKVNIISKKSKKQKATKVK